MRRIVLGFLVAAMVFTFGCKEKKENNLPRVAIAGLACTVGC
jgi:hypothetical protein